MYKQPFKTQVSSKQGEQQLNTRQMIQVSVSRNQKEKA